ncbi:nucleotidyltransferase domain-containing protein [Carboxydochorda subterranea]|uniref:Nucleotidyltransferase domain-containing protein n=1 Tax=Carboxydichorda subterranea TaxID=3109565 RepID=A0ABZ1BU13_9FIRM|nr:nucleotidyltransferase domain-containing protein [Limnochorda sp. L945t]WRP16021.1 nucleotidyltransferase domain-containing protein [Limnochorda sp. L945t]
MRDDCGGVTTIRDPLRKTTVLPVSMRRALGDIAQRYGLDLVYAFGSQADLVAALVTTGAVPSRPTRSDADIGVVFAGGLPPAGRDRAVTYARLNLELSDLLEPLMVDLVFLQENHSVFQAEAIKGHCLYAASPGVRERYEEMILRRAADFRPFLLAYLREALEG